MWVEMPDYMDGKIILEQCLEHNVAFVPGGTVFSRMAVMTTRSGSTSRTCPKTG